MSGFQTCEADPQLIAAARRGVRSAQEAIYREYADAVFSLACRIVSRRDLAEEILQDTFIEVLSKLGSFRGNAPLGAWIRRIAVNKSLMLLRSGWHRYARPLEFGVEQSAAAMDLDESGIGQVLQQLPATARAVVWLHDVEGYTHKEIAQMMKKSPSFSKSQLSRAHKRLRELLNAQTGESKCMQALSNC